MAFFHDSLQGRDAPTARPPSGRFAETSLPRVLQGRDAPTARPPLPARKTLPHGRPFLADALYFITISAKVRNLNVLALPDLARLLWGEWVSYARLGRCHPVLFLVMPDHVHGLFRFPADERMQNNVSAWKRITARRHGVRWQRDFFDHRIRNEGERMEKWDYIVMNPVRKGLVEDPTQWPFVWRESDLDCGRAVGASLPEEPFPKTAQGRDGSASRPPSGRAVGASLPFEQP